LLVQTEESTSNTKRLFVGIIKILVLVNSEFQILSCALPQTFQRRGTFRTKMLLE